MTVRLPLGLQPNALPTYYLVAPHGGGLRIMRDGSKGESTGPQTCVAFLSPETWAAILASKQPVEVKP